jgi:hypothetical protein
VLNSIDALILNEQDTTLEFVRQIYSLLTERQLLPPVKLYEGASGMEGAVRDATGATRKDLLSMGEEAEDDAQTENKRENQSLMGGMGGLSQNQSRSPQKSLAIKGPPKIINESLEIENYQGVKVTDINVRPVTTSIAQIRAQKELSSYHSNQKLDTNSVDNGALSAHDQTHAVQSQMSGSRNDRRSPSTRDVYSGFGGEHHAVHQQSNDQLGRRRQKTITDVLHDKITQFVTKNAEYGAEFNKLKIENDMVNTFFDEINKMSDGFTFNFIEELKHDVEKNGLLLDTLYHSATECSTFFSFLLVLLRRLCPVDGAFTNTMLFTKMLINRINKDDHSPKNDFNKFFFKHLFRSYCSLIRECPNKR